MFSQKPEKVTLSAPEDNSTINTTTSELDWFELENVDFYAIAVYMDAECTDSVLKKYPQKPPYKVPHEYLKPGERYFWRVAARIKGIKYFQNDFLIYH